jgi:hypothetical protein
MDLADVIDAVQGGRVRITDHADEEAVADRLSLGEIYQSLQGSEIIEDYPASKPYPSCLVYGRTAGGDQVHSVWAYNGQTHWAVLITVYRPDPECWIDWRERRKLP